MTYRVIQWTTGHVGREAVKGILEHPELELVGCYAWSEDKVGKDVGELCQVPKTGILATNDSDKLLGVKADCVCYTPSFLDIDELVGILESGHNVVSSYFVNGRTWGDDVRHRLNAAAEKGGVSLFGSGIFPGFASFIAAIMATASNNFRKVRFLESVDLSHYEAFANYANLGWGQPPDERWKLVSEDILGAYDECIDVIADLLRIPVAETRFDYEWAITPDDREFFGFSLPAGTIAGQKCSWTGMVADRPVIEIQVVWNAGKGLEPEWPVHHGYTMEVEGNPNIHTRVSFSPSEEQLHSGRAADLANPITAMPVINAIPAVCDAVPGIRTYADLPLITGHYIGG
jgi:hypothetical protein